MTARARARAFRQFVLITERLRGSASGASHLPATIVSALVHDYVSSTLFRFVIFVFRPIVACQLPHPRRSYYSTRHRLLLRSTRGVLRFDNTRPFVFSLRDFVEFCSKILNTKSVTFLRGTVTSRRKLNATFTITLVSD